MNQRPKYATLLYEVREQLGVTWVEYVYLDMVYHLSKDGWCFKSLDNIAHDLGMTKNGVVKMRDRLTDKGLLDKSFKGRVKTTVMYNSVVRSDNLPYNSVTKSYNSVYPGVQLSGTKNNNRITKNNKKIEKRENPGNGYLKALAMRNALAKRKTI